MSDRSAGALWLSAVAVLQATVAPAQTPSLVITHVHVVDVRDGGVAPDTMVTIDGNRIVGVARGGIPPPGARIVDGRGGFLVPGLWDMHAHMEAAGEAWLQLYVANGVTGIRDMGSDLDLILKMRDDTASGRIVGPRIVAAGPILDDAPEDWPYRMRVRTADEGTAAVQLLKRRGADLVKVHNNTPRDAYFAIAAEARRQNLPLAGHVPQKVSIQEAIDAGQTDIEHLSEARLWRSCSGAPEYDAAACRPLFETLARRRVWQTPTLVATSELATIGTAESSVSPEHLTYAGTGLKRMWAEVQRMFVTPEIARVFKAAAKTGAAVTRDMANAGVGILTGCDTMIAGFCVHDELEAMVRGGMTPLSALQAATLNPARFLAREGTLGRIAPGHEADLVLLDANPLEHISNVRRIRAVVASGRFFDRQELDNLLAQARAAAQR